MIQETQPKGSKATNFGMVVWITYGVISAGGHWTTAALVALVIATAIVAHEYSRDAVKIMDCTTVAFFAFALVVTFAAGPWLFKNYNIVTTWALFGVVTWVTLLIGFPFTIQYAREQAPPEIWDHPLFMRLNVILSVVFGLMFTVNALLGILALMTGRLLVLGLAIPLVLLVSAIVFSSVYPKRYTARVASQWNAAQATPAAGSNEL